MTVLEPGLHLRIPALDRIYRQSIRRRFSTVPTQSVTTADGKALTISGALGYSIADIATLYNSIHNAEDVLQTEAAAAVARYVRDRDIENCLPKEIESAVTKDLDLGRYGLSDVEFSITDFVTVRTYRLIQGQPKDWSYGTPLDTDKVEGP